MAWKAYTQTYLFWGSIVLLLGASVFYGINAQKMLRSTSRSQGEIESGSIVTLVRVVDGDTVVISQEDREPAVARILGIKSFEMGMGKDIVASYGQAAVEALDRLMKDRPVRVLLHSTPKDKYGRYIALLYAEDQDIGLHLIREGLVLVYTVYPFPTMSLYLQEQELARAGRRGLWANAEATVRALALIREWQEHSH